jgi:hypothetical protein
VAKRFSRALALGFSAALATVAAMATPAAHAGLISGVQQLVLPTCGSTSKPFAQFGDNKSYYGFPDNGFESGTKGWTVSGASAVSGNEPWYVNSTGKYSLSLPPGATAASPLVCINLLDPGWRMFARSGANGSLHAQVVFYGLTGNLTGILNLADLSPSKYTAWAPTSTITSALALPLLTSYAQLRLSSSATSGSWQVDDVFVDPWANR